jgi:hypothetical protein
MRALVILLALAVMVAAMVSLGWLYFRQGPTQTQIIIDRSKIEADAQRALQRDIEKGKEFLEDATDRLEQAGDRIDSKTNLEPDSNDGAGVPPATPHGWEGERAPDVRSVV